MVPHYDAGVIPGVVRFPVLSMYILLLAAALRHPALDVSVVATSTRCWSCGHFCKVKDVAVDFGGSLIAIKVCPHRAYFGPCLGTVFVIGDAK